MPFAARAGFLAQELVTAVVNWFDLTRQQVTDSLSTWESTATPVLTTFNTGGSHAGLSNGPYRCLVQGADGKLYGAPFAASGNILVVDPATNTSSVEGFGLSGLTNNGQHYITGLLAPNGKIYYPPLSTSLALVIDPATNTSIRTDWGITFSGSDLYDNGSVGADGKLYFVGKPGCLVIDPVANTASVNNFGTVVASSATAYRWRGGVRSTVNDKLYFAPYANTHILMIDPTNNIAVSSAHSIGTQAHQGIYNGKNGKLYMSPHNQAYWSIFDPAANVYTRISHSSAKCIGGFTGADGNVYAVPFQQSATSRFAVVDVSANTVSLNNYGITLGGTGNRWWGGVIAGNGVGYCLPDVGSSGNTHILALNTNGTGTDDPLYADIVKTSYFNKGAV
jgi:hypothetical protein